VRAFTEATRAEPGNLFFEWSKSLENPNEYVLVEAFTDEGAEPHVKSDHFAAGLEAMRPHLASTPKIISRKIDGEGWDDLASTPKIISRKIDGEGWDEMGELKID